MKRLLSIAAAVTAVSLTQVPTNAENSGFCPDVVVGPHSPTEMAASLERFLVSGGGVLYPDGIECPVVDGGAAGVGDGWPVSFASRTGQRVLLSVSRETGLYEFRDASGAVFHAEIPHSPLVWNWIAAFRDPEGASPESAGLHAPWRVSMSWLLVPQPDAAPGGGRTTGASYRVSGDIAPVSRRSVPDPFAPVSNLVFTSFSYTSSNLCFTASWPEDDPPPDGVLDLYCSTNLLQRFSWLVHTEHGATNPPHVFSVEPSAVPGWNLPSFHVHGPECPATTNIVVSPLDGVTVYTNVTYGCTPPPPFNPAGFFRLGTRRDADGDGMPDAWERLVCFSDPEDNADALFDPDADGLPNVYEWHAGTDPSIPDWDMAPKTRVGGTNAVFSLFCALAASEPYDIIEIAPGVYSGPDWCNLFMPDHPVIITTGNGGRSRDVAILSADGASTAAFWSGDDQTGHTVFQGIAVALGGREGATPIAFYIGGSPPVPGLGQGHGAMFRNVTVLLGRNPSMNTGWYLMHHGGPKVILAGCVVDGAGSVSVRGLYSIDGPDLELENCTFRAFPSDPAKARYGIHLHGMGQTGAQASVTLSGCLFDSSFSNAWPIARSGILSRHDVLMAGCALPVEFDDPDLAPDVSISNLVVAVDTFSGGHLSTNELVPEMPFSPLWHVMDIDGEPVGFPCAAGADEPGIPDPERDTDGDGLTDGDEIFSLSTSPHLRDTDGDGLSDGEEAAEGTSPLDAGAFCFHLRGTASTPAGFAFSPSLSILAGSGGTNGPLATVSVSATNGWFSFPHMVLSGASDSLRMCLFFDRNGDGIPGEDESRAFLPFAPTGHVHDAVAQFANVTDDIDGDGIPDLWEISRSLCYTNSLDAWEDPDSDGLVNLHEYWHDYNPFLPDGSNTVLSVLARSVDDRLSGNNPNSALQYFASYPALSTSMETNPLVANTSCWAADVDLSFESPWNSVSQNRKSGTLLSPKHILLAKHHQATTPLPLGSRFFFRSYSGNVYSRTLIATNSINETPNTDWLVGLLDSPLPEDVHPAKFLPADYADYIRDGRGLPSVSLDQEGKLLVADIDSLSRTASSASLVRTWSVSPHTTFRSQFYENLVSGDSSNPKILLFGYDPVVVSIHWESPGHSGTFVNEYEALLQNAMNQLSPGETNLLGHADFQSFPKLDLQ